MGHRKRKQKNPEEPDNKKSAKLQTEGGSAPVEVEATQNISVEALPRKNEEQKFHKKEKEDSKKPKKEEEDMKEPETEGNGAQSSGRKRKKKNRGKKTSNLPKKNETLEYAEKVVGILSKDDLETILKLALKKHIDIAREITDFACEDPSKRKLFVRGLGWETQPETLKSVFSAYGEVEKAEIVTDKVSGKSKGFGFVTFKSFAGVIAALKEPNKTIDNRTTFCNLSTGVPGPDPLQVAARKIYVGGVPKDVDSDKLVKLFSQYGEIEEGPLGIDKDTGKFKGFAFFIYKSERSAKNAIMEPTKTLDGATLICKPAPPKIGTQSKPEQKNMWAYGSPLTGFFPVGNPGSPFFQKALLKNR